MRSSQRQGGGNGKGHQDNVIFSIFSLRFVAPIYWFAQIQTAREDCAGREESGQRLSKEEREDSRAEEPSSVDDRENWSVDGNDERTVEERAEGERDFRLWQMVTV